MKKTLKTIGYGILGFIIFTVLVVIFNPDEKKHNSKSSNETNTSLIKDEVLDLVSEERKKEIEDSTALVKKKNYDSALKSLKSFRVKTDEFAGNKFYRDKRTPYYTNVNFIYPYLVKSNNDYWLRLKLQYTSDDWLFIDNTTFLIDGTKYEIAGNFERDNNSTIWEWLDINVDSKQRLMLNKLSKSKIAKVRYSGDKYHKDRTITSKEKSIIRKTLEVYDGLNN